MVYKITFKKRFRSRLEQVLVYLEGEFGLLVSQKFVQQIERKFRTLEKQPFIGRRSPTFHNIRSISASRQNRIYYRIEGNKIVVLNMYDTRINPNRNKFE